MQVERVAGRPGRIDSGVLTSWFAWWWVGTKKGLGHDVNIVGWQIWICREDLPMLFLGGYAKVNKGLFGCMILMKNI